MNSEVEMNNTIKPADGFDSIEDAISDISEGRMVIVVDDEDRENEGDFIMAAEKVTPEAINFMVTYGRGLVCTPLLEDRLDTLDIKPMVQDNTSLLSTAFTVSVDAVEGATTGISAHDRARTIEVLLDPTSKPTDLARPGHIFPLRAEYGGVLTRAGHTEATIDLARLAGLTPAGILCEIMSEDGSMARVPELRQVADRFGLKLITIRDLIAWRRQVEMLVHKVTVVDFPTRFGLFKLHLYESRVDDHHHMAVVKGDVTDNNPVLVRVHSQCLTGDLFHSMRCDCGDQLEAALGIIEKEGRGVLLYMRQEGRGIGLANKIRAYALQDQGRDTVEANEELGFEADLRDYGVGAQILWDLGIREIRLLTNNPRKIVGLAGHGLKVSDRVPLQVEPNEVNAHYLQTKKDKLGHIISIQEREKEQG
ncbi:bifunctional 3,4-dihydroxy-2-butanone-4-phosphate synthase/GTP cyclohydrolase II [Candidatus Zixiibacteriota bacterium]